MFASDSALPEPEEEALAISRALDERVRGQIAAAGGWMPFADFMDAMLYEPGLGYYSAGQAKFGDRGDFVTAPELSDRFAEAVAGVYRQVAAGLDAPSILEIGAGTGRLAEQILDALARSGDAVDSYCILEPSADLQARQRERLTRFGARVQWLQQLPRAPIGGLIVANEVADALPVTLFRRQSGDVLEIGVEATETGFTRAPAPAGPRLTAAVGALEDALGYTLPDDYESEMCPRLAAWIGSLADTLERGAMLVIDYGGSRREIYHPQRNRGTLICHYRHRAHADPLILPGLQDISAWVDFSACADAALDAGLHLAGYTTQAQFMLDSLQRDDTGWLAQASPQALAALKTLILPGEMGERFKLMLMTRGCDDIALAGRDLISRL